MDDDDKIGWWRKNEIGRSNLSIRASNALINAGITTINQASKLTEKQLLQIYGMGKKSATEVLDLCKSRKKPQP